MGEVADGEGMAVIDFYNLTFIWGKHNNKH